MKSPVVWIFSLLLLVGCGSGEPTEAGTRRPVRSFAPEVSLRCAGGPEGPSSGSLVRPKPSERVGRYVWLAPYVNRIGCSLFACLTQFSRSAGRSELHGCRSCHSRVV